eukprot:3611986-Prymnesium_polylepis.3
MFETLGCDCAGCCMESLPPPATPPRPPGSPNPPRPPDSPAAPPTLTGDDVVIACGVIVDHAILVRAAAMCTPPP